MTETVESCLLSSHLQRPLPLSEKQVLQHWSLRRARDRDFLSLTTMITSLPLSLSSLAMFSDVSLKRTPALFLLSLLSSALLTLVLKSKSLGRAILDICLECHCKYCVIINSGWVSRRESHHSLPIIRQQTDCYKLQVTDHREDSYYAPLPTPLQAVSRHDTGRTYLAPPDFASKYKLTIIQ